MKRIAMVLSAAVVVVALMAAPAGAVKPDRQATGPNPDIVLDDICPFPVLLHDVVNKIVVTDFFDHHGNVVREHEGGRLVEEVSRLDRNGDVVATITRSISGPGTTTFDDAGATLKATGNWLFFFSPGDVAGRPDGLMWLTSGTLVWRFDDATGLATLERHTGSTTDVCALLA